jgi:hypothetical protein
VQDCQERGALRWCCCAPAGAHPASVAGEHLVDGVHISHDDRLGGPDGSQGAKDGKQEAADKAEGGQQPAAAAKPRPEGATAATARRVLQELQLSVSGAAHAIKQVRRMLLAPNHAYCFGEAAQATGVHSAYQRMNSEEGQAQVDSSAAGGRSCTGGGVIGSMPEGC